MKPHHLIITCLLFAFFCPNINAQPFSLDEKIKPVKLVLLDDKENEGGKGIVANATIEDESQYWYVNGHDLFQMIDVYVFSNYGNPNFTVELASTNWNAPDDSQTTHEAKDGIINFKISTQGDFGIHVRPGEEKINYTIVVNASPPVQEYLGSAFVKAKPSDFNPNEGGNAAVTGNTNSNGDGGSSPTILYIIIGIALLVIGFLASKVMSKNKTATVLLLFLIPICGLAQQHGGNTWDLSGISGGQYEAWLRHQGEQNRSGGWQAASEIGAGLKRLGSLGSKVGKAVGTYNAANNAYKAYTDLNGCINRVPPKGMPRVPSFCETDDCESCFVDARRRFNQNRYTFEKLKAIYQCTRSFTDAAIAFGDNVSGYHGVSGLAWQSQKGGINKSIQELVKAYDKKYAELLETQHEILMELDGCEAEHGISDWYDRFGYLYFEFTKMNYQR